MLELHRRGQAVGLPAEVEVVARNAHDDRDVHRLTHDAAVIHSV